jgi:class 3 adenylate cyclase/tetratricopeptide (TPR) repeat protein
VICPNCSTENDTDARFCIECGTVLHAGCPTCGFVNKAGAKFCQNCGATLSGAATPNTATTGAAPAAIPVGPQVVPTNASAERRLVSILFADLVGFTPFAEERDAEQVRDTLSRYFEVASEVIARYGGTVEKFIGDAVMAVWGAPVAHEDDAERAVRAALELVDAIHGLGPGIDARAGVLTGEAAVTVGATNQGMVAGDLVNTASRLQSVAQPGTILVGEATRRATASAIAFEEAGEQVLKGKAAPVAAWRAIRVVAELRGRNRSDTLEAPFVGRDEEFRLLKDLFHQTGREKRSRLVSVIGPAGIGKSRLAWEFSKYTDGLVETTYWHVGRSPSYGDGITFWALGEMVRRRMGLAETDDEATTRAKAAETVARWVPDEAERRWIEPALLTLLGFERGGSSEQLFAAWRTFFERIAADGTVTMVFEDLHWADSGTLDFIDHLLEWSKSVPIFVVTLARPELLEKRPDWGAGKRNFVSLSVEPLPEPAMRKLLAGLVPAFPETAIRAIVARADGIPLYAVETVRMLVADGRVRLDDDTYVPVGDLTDLAVPETLTALITARLDALDATDRTLLQDAAVLGQSFTLEGLSAVSGLEESELGARLPPLARRELLELRADPRSPDRGQYQFVQALIREVAYNTLARKDRKAKHLAAARFFEALGNDELAGALAAQYLAAHTYAEKGAEADALASQARIALKAAAERAIGLGSHEQAVRFLEQALEVTSDPAEQAHLLQQAGEAASSAGRHETAERHLRHAVELHRTLGDRSATVGALAWLGRVLTSARQGNVAQALLEEASAEFADVEPGPATADLGAELARAYYLNGDPRRSLAVIDLPLEVAEHLDLAPVVADALVTKGSALAGVGRTAEGHALLRAGHELAERRGITYVLGRAIGNRTSLESELDPRAALASGRAGITLAHRLGIVNPVVVGSAAGAAIRVGEWEWAFQTLDEMLDLELEPSDRLEILGFVAEMRAYRGDPAGDVIAEIEALTAGATDVYRRWPKLWSGIAVAEAAGELSAARKALHQIADLFADPWPYPRAARCALWLGDAAGAAEDLARYDAGGRHGPGPEADRATIRAGVAALEGRPSDALALYRQALREWRELGCVWDEALAGIDMASLLDPAEPEVRAATESSREILTRLGARPFLGRLEDALARQSRDLRQEPESSAVQAGTPAA